MKSSVLVTGGAGFIGTALCRELIGAGERVVCLDNFSRPGSRQNAAELSRIGVEISEVDVADIDSVFDTVRALSGSLKTVFHLAAQVAVTTSYRDPQQDFRWNALGTFNLLEAVRLFSADSHVVYASTNKVYGRGQFVDPIGLNQPPAPATPYGVSKYVGDLYLEDYRSSGFGPSATVFRQSCIYGAGQLGVEDQGWLAWFSIANLMNREVTVFGDGNQVRDLLYVNDLIRLYLAEMNKPTSGTYVVGGGESNAISITSALDAIQEITGIDYPSITFEEARPGDQLYFVSGNEGLWNSLGWAPSVSVGEGMVKLIEWQAKHIEQISTIIN